MSIADLPKNFRAIFLGSKSIWIGAIKRDTDGNVSLVKPNPLIPWSQKEAAAMGNVKNYMDKCRRLRLFDLQKGITPQEVFIFPIGLEEMAENAAILNPEAEATIAQQDVWIQLQGNQLASMQAAIGKQHEDTTKAQVLEDAKLYKEIARPIFVPMPNKKEREA